MIKLNLSTLAHARVGRDQTVELAIDAVSLGDGELRNVRGVLQLTRVAGGVLVQGELTMEVETECTRCLTPFFEPVTIELKDTIGLPGASLTPERPVRIHEDGWVDLTPLVREYAWLGLPTSPLCSPGCKGLCPECGGNRNTGECTCADVPSIDPRWAVLQQLAPESDST